MHMPQSFHDASRNAFAQQYAPLTAEALVTVFNTTQAGNQGWTTARANALTALRTCFLQTGYDVSDFIHDNYMLCDALLEMSGERICRGAG